MGNEARILKIDSVNVLVGLKNGETMQLARHLFDFQPQVDQTVEIYRQDDNYFITLAKEQRILGDAKKINKVSYILLALFLGGIGAHKFYEGKDVWGILYLLFCWTFIPAIIAILEIIVMLSKKSDENGMVDIV